MDKFVRSWTESNFQVHSQQAVREWAASVSKAPSHTLLQLLCSLTAASPIPQHHTHPTTITEQHPGTLQSVFKSKKSCERAQMQSFLFIKVVSPPWAELWESVGVLQQLHHPQLCVLKVVSSTKTTNWPAEPLTETKKLRATKQLIAQHWPQPGNTPALQTSSQTMSFSRSNSHPASLHFSVRGTGLAEGSDWQFDRSRSGTDRPCGGTDPTAALLMSIFSCIISPPTKDTASSKGQNLHQPCHLTHKDTLYSNKWMGKDKEGFRHSLHNTRMTNAWKNVWEGGDW